MDSLWFTLSIQIKERKVKMSKDFGESSHFLNFPSANTLEIKMDAQMDWRNLNYITLKINSIRHTQCCLCSLYSLHKTKRKLYNIFDNLSTFKDNISNLQDTLIGMPLISKG